MAGFPTDDPSKHRLRDCLSRRLVIRYPKPMQTALLFHDFLDLKPLWLSARDLKCYV